MTTSIRITEPMHVADRMFHPRRSRPLCRATVLRQFHGSVYHILQSGRLLSSLLKVPFLRARSAMGAFSMAARVLCTCQILQQGDQGNGNAGAAAYLTYREVGEHLAHRRLSVCLDVMHVGLHDRQRVLRYEICNKRYAFGVGGHLRLKVGQVVR